MAMHPFATSKAGRVVLAKAKEVNAIGILSLNAMGSPLMKRQSATPAIQSTGWRPWPLLTFLWLYVARCGSLDGAAGYRFCLLRACHEAITEAKVMEAEQRRSSSDRPTSDRVSD